MPEKNITMTRILEQYGYAGDEFKKCKITDKYDPMDWDDFVSVLGYLAEGHRGQTITIEFSMKKEENENGKA